MDFVVKANCMGRHIFNYKSYIFVDFSVSVVVAGQHKVERVCLLCPLKKYINVNVIQAANYGNIIC